MIYLLSLALTGLCVASSQAEVLKIAADPWCPFTCSASSEGPGIYIEVLRQAFGPEVVIEYEELSWTRALTDVRTGKFDAVAGALRNDAPGFIFPNESLGHQRSCFYTAPDSAWTYKDVSSLKGRALGAVKDYNYGEPVDSYIKAHESDTETVDLMTGTETALRLVRKVLDHRVEVIIEDSAVVDYHSSQKAFKTVPRLAGCLKKEPLYVAFSPKDAKRSRHLAERFTAGLRALKSKGQLQKIFARYGLKAPP